MEEMILTLEKLALKHGQSMQLSILLRWWNMLVAPASGGFHAASRRMALLTQELFCSSDKPQSKFAGGFGRDARNNPRDAGATVNKQAAQIFRRGFGL
jgi:hypothetical protein